MVRDPARSQQISSSSRNLTSILAKYVPEWMGEDAFDGLFFHPPWVQCYVCSDVGIRTIFAECESSKTPRKSQLIRAERSCNGCALASRTRTHGDHFLTSYGELAVLPLGMAIETLVVHVGRFRCASFALSPSSLVSLFSYLCRILRFYGYGYFGTYWTYGYFRCPFVIGFFSYATTGSTFTRSRRWIAAGGSRALQGHHRRDHGPPRNLPTAHYLGHPYERV